MKKLIMLLAAVALFGAANAAMIDWSVAKNATKNYAGTATAMTVYLMTSAQWDAVKDAVAKEGASALTSGTYLMSATSSTTGAVLNEKVAVPGAPGTRTTFYNVIFDSNSGKDYYKAVSADQAIYDPNDEDYSTAKTVSFVALKFNGVSWNEIPVVPEPTSGLLLLVGAGILGLRRRRA